MDEIDVNQLNAMPPDMQARMIEASPFAKAMGIKLVSLTKARALLSLAYQDKLIGNPLTRVVHGGGVTALLDHASGFAVFSALEAPTSIATLDMRIDYMRAAEPGETILADAHCFKLTNSIAFVRGTAYHDTMDNPIATMVGTYMLASDAGRKPGANLK